MHEGPRNKIIEQLQFNDEQIKKYDVLISWHRAEIRKHETQMLELRNTLYSGLVTASVPNDSIVRVIATLQEQIEKVHYKHFSDIRSICTNEQLPLFNKLLLEIAAMFNKRMPAPKK
jgi:periplasmic protein CpxP/Spy